GGSVSDWKRIVPVWMILMALAVGCAAPGPTRSDAAGDGSAPRGREAVKRIVLGTGREPNTGPLSRGQPTVIKLMLNAGLTVTVTWKQPYIDADALFGARGVYLPLPRHLLEGAYRADKASLLDLPYWTQEFVGTGPYRLREWTTGVGVRLEANAAFVLGRPRI